MPDAGFGALAASTWHLNPMICIPGTFMPSLVWEKPESLDESRFLEKWLPPPPNENGPNPTLAEALVPDDFCSSKYFEKPVFLPNCMSRLRIKIIAVGQAGIRPFGGLPPSLNTSPLRSTLC